MSINDCVLKPYNYKLNKSLNRKIKSFMKKFDFVECTDEDGELIFWTKNDEPMNIIEFRKDTETRKAWEIIQKEYDRNKP